MANQRCDLILDIFASDLNQKDVHNISWCIIKFRSCVTCCKISWLLFGNFVDDFDTFACLCCRSIETSLKFRNLTNLATNSQSRTVKVSNLKNALS
jgi:hypothetical protein